MASASFVFSPQCALFVPKFVALPFSRVETVTRLSSRGRSRIPTGKVSRAAAC